jgi:heme/copper-type cytochrome/quinol oxidase subunit 3
MKEKLLYLGVGMLFTHELDAMRNHEWLVLPLTSWLPSEYGEAVFIWTHIPLFAILVAALASLNMKIRQNTRLGFSIFLVIHGILHAAFSTHEKYEFASLTSNVLIFGGAICGALYLLLNGRASRT